MTLFEDARLVGAVNPQSLNGVATGSWVAPQTVDRLIGVLAVGIMAAANKATLRLVQAKDAAGTGKKALKAAGGTAEAFTIDLSGHPANTGSAGKSFDLSVIDATGAELKYQPWLFVTNESAPSPVAGYTALKVDVSAGWSDAQILAAFRATVLNNYCTFGCTAGVLTVTNKNTGYLTAPADVNTGGAVTVTAVGADSSQIIATGAMMAETFTFDFNNGPAGGKSICFSTLTAAGVEHKWQVWFKINGVGAAPSAQSGYTLAEVDAASWTDAGLAAAIAAAVSAEASVSIANKVATIANAYSGKCSGPFDVDTKGKVIEIVNGIIPVAMVDAPTDLIDEANGFGFVTAEVTTSVALLVSATFLHYLQKISEEFPPRGVLL